MEIRTHQDLDRRLAGTPTRVDPGRAVVTLTATEAMRADRHGLVHGGFVFALADHAAMLAINHPNVVLGAAELRFLQPVTVGDTLVADAALVAEEGKKQRVTVVVRRGQEAVMRGELVCFSPPHHVLAAAPEEAVRR